MSIRVDREEIEAGRWYQVKQGSVLIPMFLDCWESAMTAIMFTRSQQGRRVSILNIVDGWDDANQQLFDLKKTGTPITPMTPMPASEHCPGCRQCSARVAIKSKPMDITCGSIAFQVLTVLKHHTPLDSSGITDECIRRFMSGFTGGSVRGRRADLVKLGYAEATRTMGKTMNGGKCKRWCITAEGAKTYERERI